MSCNKNGSQANEPGTEPEVELQKLREENARLKSLLIRHGIAWEKPLVAEQAATPPQRIPATTHFTTGEKIALFRRLFRGRTDIYPLRC